MRRAFLTPVFLEEYSHSLVFRTSPRGIHNKTAALRSIRRAALRYIRRAALRYIGPTQGCMSLICFSFHFLFHCMIIYLPCRLVKEVTAILIFCRSWRRARFARAYTIAEECTGIHGILKQGRRTLYSSRTTGCGDIVFRKGSKKASPFDSGFPICIIALI